MTTGRRGRVVMAMSGGVDSSVSACLLTQQGYEVIGLFMRTGAHEAETVGCDLETGNQTSAATGDHATPKNTSIKTPVLPKKIRGCCSAIDAGDARRVADHLNIPFYALNFQDEFQQIKDYFVEEYLHSRTPNPCVMCNTWLKFGKLWEYAQAVEADYIATGHYARVVTASEPAAPAWTDVERGFVELHRGVDEVKDQSYFLFGIRREMLQRLFFPIGHLPKSEVRRLAAEFGLEVHRKPDSQEICFVPGGDYQKFIRQHRPDLTETPGEIVDVSGKVVGEHQGLSRFTVGQRKGLGVAVGEPRYVVELQPAQNRVLIGPQELLLRDSLQADRVNWLLPEIPSEPVACAVKIRHVHKPAPALVVPLADDRVEVRFQQPQSAVTPGQAAVFYSDSHVLGGGWIC